MKIKRAWLMAVLAAAGSFMILYTVARQIFGFTLGEAFEDNLFNGVLIVALAVFTLNRKLASDEKAERAKAAAALEDADPASQDPADPVSQDPERETL